MQVQTIGGETEAMTQHQRIEAAEIETGRASTAQGSRSISSWGTSDGPRGQGNAAPGASALTQEPVLGQPGIKLLARYLQQFGSVGFVVAGNLQSSLDELALGSSKVLVEETVS